MSSLPFPAHLSPSAFTLESPAVKAIAITPNDGVDLPVTVRALWVGGAGAVRVLCWLDTATVDIVGIPAGTLLPMAVKRVHLTGTTATSIVGLA